MKNEVELLNTLEKIQKFEPLRDKNINALKHEDFFLNNKLYEAVFEIENDLERQKVYNQVLLQAEKVNARDIFENTYSKYEEKITPKTTHAKEENIPSLEKIEINQLYKKGLLPPLNNNSDLTDTMQKICATDIFKPIKTELPFYDELTGGMHKQSISFLLARSGAGKTTFCQQLACALALKKIPVLYYNFEMSREQLIAKDLSRINNEQNENSLLTANGILKYNEYNNDETRVQIDKLFEKYKNINDFLKYNPSKYISEASDEALNNNVEKVINEITTLAELYKKVMEPAPVVFIDYLQLLQSENKDLQEAIKENVLKLKEYAIKYDTAVYVVSAVNREAQKQGTLNIASGRDSSNIEYTGDNILILDYKRIAEPTQDERKTNHQIEKEEKRKNTRKMKLSLEKNRFGIDKDVNLYFYADKGLFTEWKHASEDEQKNFNK